MARDELLVAECHGRLEVAIKARQVTLTDWVDLPPADAIEHFRKLEVVDSKAWSKLDAAYKRKAFGVSGDLEQYVVESMHSYIDAAIADGISKGEFLKRIGEVFDGMGLTPLSRHHLETVFDTNVLSSYAHGKYRQQRHPDVMARRPLWKYLTVGDKSVRPSHAAMDGKTYRADDDIWNTWYPPNGFRCRCTVLALTEAEGEVSRERPKVQPDEGFATGPEDWLD